mgnify:CR=1 FL=1
MNVAIVLAAGIGSRFGANEPKQFYLVNAKPIIAYTLDVLEECNDIDAIQIVIRIEHQDRIKKIINKYGYKKVKWITIGGNSFQRSVMNGVYALAEKKICTENNLIQLHVASSPLITTDIIHNSFEICIQYGNAFSAEPIRFPLCYSLDGKKANSINEAGGFYLLEPPWTFKAKEIYALYKRAEHDGILDTIGLHTISLYNKYERDVFLSDYVTNNIKITTIHDILMFETLLDYRDKDKNNE